MALKENQRKVFDYVKENDGENFTAADIGLAVGLETRSVNGIITGAFARKGKDLMERVPAEIELEDGTRKAVKFVRLTDKGRLFNPDAEDEAE